MPLTGRTTQYRITHTMVSHVAVAIPNEPHKPSKDWANVSQDEHSYNIIELIN